MKFGDEMLDLTGREVTLARIISRLTGAPLINFYVGTIMIIFAPPLTFGVILSPLSAFLICMSLMVVTPILPILYQAWRGNIDLDISTQKMRARFFGFAILCYTLAFMMYFIAQSPLMYNLAAAYACVTAGVMLANFRTKVSVHSAGVAGPGTALILVYGPAALFVIILWIVVVWSRVILKQHSLNQGLLGIGIGVIITLIVYAFLYPIPIIQT